MSFLTALKKSLPDIFRFVRFVSPKLKKERPLVTGGFVALFLEVSLQLLEPWPLKFIIDHVLMPTETENEFISSLTPESILLFSAGGLVVIVMLRALFGYLSVVSFALVGNKVLTAVRNDLYKHIHTLSLGYHSKSKLGDVVIRTIGDVGLLKEVAVTAMLPLLGNIVVLFGMILVMFILHWKLTLLSLVIVPLFWMTTLRLSGRIKSVAKKQRKREGKMAATAAESLGAMKVIKALSLSNAFISSFNSQGAKSLKEGVKAKRLSVRLERTVDVLVGIGTALVLWYGAHLVMVGELTAGSMLVFLFYLKAAFKPVKNFAKFTGRLSKAAAAGDRVLEIFDVDPEVKDSPNALRARHLKGEIDIKNLSFSYEEGHVVLEDIQLSVRNGQTVAIVGESGSGKSTILSLILRLYDPSNGSILIDNKDIRTYTMESLRDNMSVVLQDTVLFASSIYDNIAFGCANPDKERVIKSAKLANADKFINKLPQGYETEVGERGITLSSGQRQRIAIARAAMRDTPILLLDEPNTGLDEENEQQVMDALRKISEGRTCLLVTHDLRHAVHADMILFMQEGKVVEKGSHEELMSLDGYYAAYAKSQLNTSVSNVRSIGNGVVRR